MNLDKETLRVLHFTLDQYDDNGIITLSNGEKLLMRDAKIALNRLLNGKGENVDLAIYKQLMAWYIARSFSVGM